METIVVDVFEKADFAKELAKTLVVYRENLVPLGLADVYWFCGHRITLEHKTIEQVFQEMGGRLDDQLRKHSRHAEEVGLVIHGIATPCLNEPRCDLWLPSKDGQIFYKSRRKIGKPWEAFQAYLWRLDKEGFTVYQAPTVESLCLAISAFVYNSMKSDFKSLRRYVKTQPVVWEEEDTDLYHHIRTLMSVSGARIGEITARKLLEVYRLPNGKTSPMAVFMANPFDGKWPAGEIVFKQVQRGIGRGQL